MVIHIIHNGEAVGAGTNISQAQATSQMTVLNEDFRKLNPDGNNLAIVPPVFQPARADAQVQFVMANIDPSGNPMPEPGIDRVNRNTKGFIAGPYTQIYINSTIKPATDWDPSKYVNIWVMNLGGGLLGYAQFPDNTAGLAGLNGSGGAANTDGVVILYSAFGSRLKVPTGTYITPYDRGRTLTHELGHWLGLRHIWGDANCGNDYCNDTPTQAGPNGGCPTFPHISCLNSGDQSMNYMDYSDDACTAMFSNDQVNRIQAVLLNTPHRTELVNSPVVCPNGTVVATAANNGPGCAGGNTHPHRHRPGRSHLRLDRPQRLHQQRAKPGAYEYHPGHVGHVHRDGVGYYGPLPRYCRHECGHQPDPAHARAGYYLGRRVPRLPGHPQRP